MLAVAWGTQALADLSCTLKPAPRGAPTTLLVRELQPDDQAVILVSGRTLVFDCPVGAGTGGVECYGQADPPMNAPTQLNIASDGIGPGAVVVVTTRNVFFGKNEHIGYHRRHSTVRVLTITSCDPG